MYVIKNCDNYTDFDKDWTCRSTIQNRKACFCCADCTDCVMKQIVELCEEESSLVQHKQKVKVKGLNKLADKILELLDKQEVE